MSGLEGDRQGEVEGQGFPRESQKASRGHDIQGNRPHIQYPCKQLKQRNGR